MNWNNEKKKAWYICFKHKSFEMGDNKVIVCTKKDLNSLKLRSIRGEKDL